MEVDRKVSVTVLFQEELFDKRSRRCGWEHYKQEGRSPELPASAVMQYGVRAELVPVTTVRDCLSEGIYITVALSNSSVAGWLAWPSFL